MKINHNKDGIDHINVYSKGVTYLGRMLSNFAETPFECEDGKFSSVEGYWYWLSSPPEKREILRGLSGWKAKETGRVIGGKDWLEENEFKIKIKAAIDAKFIYNPEILTLLKQNILPLKHYYVYNDKVVEPKKGKWVIEYLEEKRKG